PLTRHGEVGCTESTHGTHSRGSGQGRARRVPQWRAVVRHWLPELVVFIAGFLLLVWGGPSLGSLFGVALPGYATLDDFLPDAVVRVNDYWQHRTFPRARPYTAPRVVLLPADELPRCRGSTGAPSSTYCSDDRTIYVYRPGMD